MGNEHPKYELGRRPPKRAPSLKLADFFDAAAVPPHDPKDDNLAGLPFGLYENDKYGDCGPTSVANDVIAVTLGHTVPTQDHVFDLYRRSGNPNFDPKTGADDNGVDMQTMLEALLAGGIGGKKPVAFAQIDVRDTAEIDAAINAFAGVLFGVDLQVAQQAQTDAKVPVWDYSRSGEWGGHAILAGRYDEGKARQAVISWALTIDTTEAFRTHQLEEAWIVIWPETLANPAVDVHALAAAYKDLTGEVLPLPVPPSPAPDPTPPEPVPPAPDPSPPAGGVFQVGPFTARQGARLVRQADRHGFRSVESYLTYIIKHGPLR